jgi:hypothetical protein
MNDQRQTDMRMQATELLVSADTDVRLTTADELDWLMSLALDDELDAAGEARLNELLAQEALGAERWHAWQVLDADLARVPAVLPPANFVQSVERRIAIHERQRRLRAGAVFGLVAVTLWTSAMIAVCLLGAFFWTNQSAVLGGLVHNFAAWWTAMRQVGIAFLQAGEALLASEQTRTAMTIYLSCAVAILAGWFVFLRRTLQIVPEYDA